MAGTSEDATPEAGLQPSAQWAPGPSPYGVGTPGPIIRRPNPWAAPWRGCGFGRALNPPPSSGVTRGRVDFGPPRPDSPAFAVDGDSQEHVAAVSVGVGVAFFYDLSEGVLGGRFELRLDLAGTFGHLQLDDPSPPGVFDDQIGSASGRVLFRSGIEVCEYKRRK